MKQTEILQEHEFRLKQLDKQSKDNSKQFRYLSSTQNKIVTIKN